MSNEFKPKNGLILPDQTATTVPYLDADKKVTSSAVTPTELGYVSGVTSALQTQINAKAPSASPTFTGTVTLPATVASGAATITLPTTTQTLATIAGTETLTNKTLTSPSLTTPSTDIITLDGQASTPASPSAGNYKAYVKDATQKLTILDSSGVETTVGSGSGSNNYITANDGTTIGDWAGYTDAAATSPVDGTGGATPNSTFAVSTSSTMRGTTNFLFTKNSGASRQGEGFSYLMAIDPSDRGKVLRLSFDYLVASGTYADDDLQIWFYDATNAALIQPAPYKIKNSSIIERFSSEVQVPSSCASLRVIFHVAVATDSSNTIRFDDFVFGQQAKLYGSAVTDWQTATLTLTNVGNGTVLAKKRRVGDVAEYNVEVSIGSSLPTGIITINLDSTIDSTKIPGAGNTSFGVAAGGLTADANLVHLGQVRLVSYTAISIYGDDGAGFWTNTVPITWDNGSKIRLNFSVPILGWSSSQVMSSDADTRVVRSTITSTSTQSVTSPASKFQFNTIVKDSHGTFDATTNYRYTVVVPGTYTFDGSIPYATAGALLTSAVYLYKNGSSLRSTQISAASGAGYGISFDFQDDAVAGDYYEIFAFNSTAVSAVSGAQLNIRKLSGPSQIAASESVSCRCTGATATVTGTASIVTWSSEDWDSHGSMSTTTFTAPMSGTYLISALLRMDHASVTTANYAILQIYKNGAGVANVISQGASGNTIRTVSICEPERLLAGETISIYVSSDGTTPTISAQTAYNKLSITRTGNY